jgi:hypothetical protein
MCSYFLAAKARNFSLSMLFFINIRFSGYATIWFAPKFPDAKKVEWEMENNENNED